MQRLKKGSAIGLLVGGIAALFLLRSEAPGMSVPASLRRFSTHTGAVQDDDPVRHLCVGKARIDLEASLTRWDFRPADTQEIAPPPCARGLSPTMSESTLLAAASTRSGARALALLRLKKKCELAKQDWFSGRSTIEAAAEHGVFIGAYRSNSTTVNTACWNTGPNSAFALLVKL